MSNTKEVRELQFTRMQLIIVFVLVIALGAFIFVLGVSVGKKQARLALGLESTAGPATEVVKPKVKAPADAGPEKPDASAPSEIQKELASFQTREKTGQDAKASPKTKPAAKTEAAPPAANKTTAARPVPAAGPPAANLLYIQVAAVTQKTEAARLAETIRKLGFSVYVLDPLAGDRTPYYRVRVGGYKTEEERNRAGERLAAALDKKPGDFYYPPR